MSDEEGSYVAWELMLGRESGLQLSRYLAAETKPIYDFGQGESPYGGYI